jgi:hypothetical protein
VRAFARVCARALVRVRVRARVRTRTRAGVAAVAAVAALVGTASPGAGSLAGATVPAARRAHLAGGGEGTGLIAGRTSAIGDSLMIDYEAPLEHDLAGVVVDADVSRQFSTGISVVAQLRAQHRLGTRVVIDLGTNGTVTTAEFRQMLAMLRGVRRVVFVTVHVDRPWQGEVNAVLRAGVAAHPKQARLADWAALAARHPGWFYGDGTHLPIGGPGAVALAALVTAAVTAR